MPDSERFIATLRSVLATAPRPDLEKDATTERAEATDWHAERGVVTGIAAALGDPMSLPKADGPATRGDSR